jgi:hypothetical protein
MLMLYGSAVSPTFSAFHHILQLCKNKISEIIGPAMKIGNQRFKVEFVNE